MSSPVPTPLMESESLETRLFVLSLFFVCFFIAVISRNIVYFTVNSVQISGVHFSNFVNKAQNQGY